MLYKVEVRTDKGATLVLPLEYTDNGYLIQNIDGLDPVKAVVSSSPFGNMDGEQYQSSRRDARNIVITLGLENSPAGPVRLIRSKLYDFFMPKERVRMQFFDDEEPMVEIEGIVESCLSPLFAKEPVATISVLCHNPDFYNPSVVIIYGNTVSTTAETTINYTGSIETGINLTLRVDRAMDRFVVYHRSSFDTIYTLEFNQPLISGDVLTISTSDGDKGAILNRSGIINSLIYGIPTSSNYIHLTPGTNKIRVYAEGVAVPFTIGYTNKIGGL